ncbi:MAG: hypothetical protein PCFJNLEI_03170 [Verrucomicrobiae bacterium]|nr:hypothetical protein [Verrucomicrobiae bacterium]
MKALRFCRPFVIAALAVTVATAVPAADVYSVKFGFAGTTQDEVNGQPALESVKATAANLINIARGRAPNAAVPPSEVLAVVLDCDAALRLIVFDTVTKQSLVTIVTPTEVNTAGNPKTGVAVVTGKVNATGGLANSLNGGYLVFTGKASLDLNGCPTKASFAVTGVINATITDDLGIVTSDVLVLKGKLSLGTKLGTIAP